MGGLFGAANVANHTRALSAAETVAGNGRSLPKSELAPALRPLKTRLLPR